jgi:hypothetical protein
VPTKSRKENTFIERFLSAYENYSWADANVDWLDERIDGAVEALATRKSDGRTLAIEHTIIEPFVSDKEDFAFFQAAFLGIEKDETLPVPGRWIRVFIPVGTLRGQRKKAVRDTIVEAVHCWIKTNRLSIPDGFSEHRCASVGMSAKGALDITLYIRVVPLPGSGKLHVRRQQIDDNLDDVIDKALKKKLPKLVQTNADRRILLLERQHMNLYPSRMLEEIEKRKGIFPELARVDEIWILETMFYESEGYLRFERFENGTLVGSLDFSGARLFDKFENGMFVIGPASTQTS